MFCPLKHMKNQLLCMALLLLPYSLALTAQTFHERDSVKIYFQQGKTDLIPELRGNQSALNRIIKKLRDNHADTLYQLKEVEVTGAASPEGSIRLNQRLSEERAKVLFDYLSQYSPLPDSLRTSVFLGRDWKGLARLVEADPNVPARTETLALLQQIIQEVYHGTTTQTDALTRLQQLQGGAPYRYMYRHLFPELRASQLNVAYKRVKKAALDTPPHRVATVVFRTDTVYIHDSIYVEMPRPCRPFYMSIRTNMLYDVAAIPNLGVEFYLKKGWSIGADWMYAWWKTDRKHRYWRTYGGELAVRKWLGKAAREKPLTGHHLGFYGQILTYDFEWGGRGYLGGKPGGTLWDKMNWGVGLEYGYSLPVTRRLNIDFGFSVGYLSGEYQEYLPEDGCYVWQATKKRRWFGPTKANISLVWLIGCDNYNSKKGGRR